METSNGHLQVMVKIIAPDGLGQELLGVMQPLLGSIRSRSGCLACSIFQDAENLEEMALYEEWENEAAFASHVSSSDYRYILEWMEQSVAQPEITVCKKISQDGFTLIEKIRKAQ